MRPLTLPRQRALAGLLTLVVAGIPQAALAWGSLILLDPTPDEDKLAFGASAWRVPRSPDGRHAEHLLTPAVDYYRHDGWFVSTETGVGYNASRSAAWQAGLRLWPQFGRARQDASAAWPRIGPRLQTQAFANASVADVALLQSAISSGSGIHHDGVQTELGVTSGIPWEGGSLGLTLATTYANRAFRRDYTGVDHAGWTDWSWALSAEQKLGGAWRMDAQFQRATILRPPSASGSPRSTWHPQAVLISLWRNW